MRSVDAGDPGLDLFPDGALDDTLLEVFDAAAQTATTLCPADLVAVAAGRAAFLRPESPIGTGTCTGGSLNGDGDTDDRVVQLWESGAPSRTSAWPPRRWRCPRRTSRRSPTKRVRTARS